MNSNSRTLTTYEDAPEAYIKGTPQVASDEVQTWMDRIIERLSPPVQILEIGSASGRDAAYFEARGLSVQRTDAAESFVRYMRQHGQDAGLFNVLTDDLKIADLDLVFANAVLVHFTDQEVGLALYKVHAALRANGLFAFSVKQGKGEEWSEHKMAAPRYFNYWRPTQLRELIEAAGFIVDELSQSSNRDWLQVIARKA